jgi:A nuclease of the HNH/ENDO VII superfamily with conserved WHH
MKSSKTRSEAQGKRTAAERQGLNADEILPDSQKRRTQPPDHFGAPPQVTKDSHGNSILLPGSAAITEKKMKLSGDSNQDIKKLVDQTGQGGPGSGQTWHHKADYDDKTGQGTVTLMPTQYHQGHPHIGGSAQQRANDNGGDPDRKAKYGYP